MRTMFYKFADGYFCYIAGKMDRTEKALEIKKHGAIIIEKIC